MQEKHLFEYAVVRVVPRVERGEFLNIGVILYCRQQKYLGVRFTLNEERLRIFSGSLDIQDLQAYVTAFEKICAGGNNAGTIGRLDMASRFRWLTATRSTILQTSEVHPGLCADAAETLSRLHTNLVL